MKWYFRSPSGGVYGGYDNKEQAEIEATKFAENFVNLIEVFHSE